jgi:8-oxo-dGTP pyrophosphatase MutT (NUDIX family)
VTSLQSFLDGVDADHIRSRLEPRGTVPAPKLGERYAAVAIVLRDGPRGIESLLIQRAQLEGDPWSGHMAFPGGRHDPTDPDLLWTAIRETREEVGLDLETGAAYLGRLDLVPAIAKGRLVGLTIAPFVFQLSGDPPLVPNHEVMAALWAPLSDLASGAHATVVRFTMKEQELELPAWDIEGRVVWGLTYRMLQALLEDLSPPT